MLVCEICGLNKATISYVPIFDKNKKTIYICEKCDELLRNDTRLQNYKRMDEKITKMEKYQEHLVLMANRKTKYGLLETELKILKRKLLKCKDDNEIIKIKQRVRQIEKELKDYIMEIEE